MKNMYETIIGEYPDYPVLKFMLTQNCIHEVFFEMIFAQNPDMENIIKKKK